MKAPSSTGKRPARRPAVVDLAFIDAVALHYLNRFDAPTARLRQVIARRVQSELERTRVATEQASDFRSPEASQIEAWIDEVIGRLQRSGVVDDQRFSGLAVARLRERGASARAISEKLRQRGIEPETAREALAAAGPENEFEAALRLCRRRKLGRFRPSGKPFDRRRELAVLARAGFSFDVAARALGPSSEDESF